MKKKYAKEKIHWVAKLNSSPNETFLQISTRFLSFSQNTQGRLDEGEGGGEWRRVDKKKKKKVKESSKA